MLGAFCRAANAAGHLHREPGALQTRCQRAVLARLLGTVATKRPVRLVDAELRWCLFLFLFVWVRDCMRVPGGAFAFLAVVTR